MERRRTILELRRSTDGGNSPRRSNVLWDWRGLAGRLWLPGDFFVKTLLAHLKQQSRDGRLDQRIG